MESRRFFFHLSNSPLLLLLDLTLALAAATFAAATLAAGSPLDRPALITDSSLVDAAGLCASLVNPLGYECQQFEVKTRDGYLLTVQRIPQGRGRGGADDDDEGKRQPVLLQHGVLMDGTQWVLLPPEQSLAFILADEGFDVWIANIRGTRWSRRHVSLDPSSRAYWEWSWDDLAEFDLPATVDFVFDRTGQKLHFVAHSMGTTIMMAALSEGMLVDKLRSIALLTPVAYLDHITTQLAVIAARLFAGEVLSLIGVAEFNPKGEVVEHWLRRLCHVPDVNCYDFFATFTGNNCCLNRSSVDIFLEYEPQPTSMKTMIHFAQTSRDGVVRKFNYDSSVMNMYHYGRSEPPTYNLSNVPQGLPVFLSHGGRDFLADVKDVQHLLSDLQGHQQDRLAVQYVEEYAHVDFIMGSNAKTVVYDTMLQFLRAHSLGGS